MELSDPLVNILCSQPGPWGISALAHSTEAYRAHSAVSIFQNGLGLESFSQEQDEQAADNIRSDDRHAELPERFRKFLIGTPWEVESFVRELMVEGDADSISANIKFLFVILPLRSPTKYGLSSTQGVQLVTRIINMTAHVYALENGDNSEALKRIWLRAFADSALYVIQDEDLLTGMLSNPPSKESLEALASTPFMQTVLTFKFQSGPVLIFYTELCLFVFLCTMVLGSILVTTTSLVTVLLGLCATAYFTIRELHHIFDSRAKEIELTKENELTRKKTRRRSSIAGGAFRQPHISSSTEGPASLMKPQTQDWRQSPKYRRMSMNLFGISYSQEITLGGDDEDGDEVDEVSGVSESVDSLVDEDNEPRTRSTIDVNIKELSYFVTVYLGLAEAWRQNAFKCAFSFFFSLARFLSPYLSLLCCDVESR